MNKNETLFQTHDLNLDHYKVAILVHRDLKITVLNNDERPEFDDVPLLIITGHVGDPYVELSFGRVEGIKIHMKTLKEAIVKLDNTIFSENFYGYKNK